MAESDNEYSSCYGPPSPKDYGFTLNLNNIIQCLSSCNLFIFRIDKMSSENKNLSNLSIFNELLKTVKDNSVVSQDLFCDRSFKEWNDANHQYSFDLLMLIMNSVYGQKRSSKLSQSIDDWLKEYLPMRILLRYKYYCDCGYEAFSPLQSELSIYVPARGKSMTSLQSLVDTFFSVCIIDGRVCDTKDCSRASGMQIRELLIPLPETLCLHLERDGNNTKVKHEVNLIIKSQYYIGVLDKDITYYLKSLIITGEQICYKKMANHWYSVTKSFIDLVSEATVFSSQADVLFYELRDEATNMDIDNLSDIPVPLVKYCLNDNLHCVIQALSSCDNIIKWITASDNELGVLPRLMAIANGDDEELDAAKSKYLEQMNVEKSADILKIVKDLLDHIIKDVRSDESENDGECMGTCTPWQFITSHLLECHCGSKIVMNTEKVMSVNISMPDEDTEELQTLIDNYFLNEIDTDHKCPKSNCSMNKVSRRLLLHHPLPTMICVYLEDDSDCTVKISDKVKLLGQFSLISDRSNKKSFSDEYTVFDLKSVVTDEDRKCYRKLNDEWFCVDDKTSERVTLVDVLSCNASILFYELRVKSEENCDMETSVRDVASGDILDEEGTLLNRIIQSFASCVKFVDWLNIVSDYADLPKLRTFACLINIVNRTIKVDKEVDTEVLERWNDIRCSDVYEFILIIFDEIIKELSGNKVDHPITIYNCGTMPTSSGSQTKWSIDLAFTESMMGLEPVSLQKLLDNHFEIWAGYGELHFKSMKEDLNPIPLNEALPDTICFHLDDRLSRNYVRPVLDIVVKNISCIQYRSCQSDYTKCCRKYCLRALIARDGYGYKIGVTSIYKITKVKYVPIEEDELLCLDPIIMMYEWQQ